MMITFNVTCASCLECGNPSGRWVALIPSTIGNMIPTSQFYSCSLIGVIIPTSVQIISISAFEKSNLKSVVIPTSVLWIGNYAFYKATALKAVVIPTSVSSIGQYSFSYSALESLFLPFSTTFVGDGAFQECKNLTTVYIQSAPGGSRMYESWVFLGDYALQCVFADPSDFDTVAASCQITCPLIFPCSQDPSFDPTSYPTVSMSIPTYNPAATAAPQMRPTFYPTSFIATTPSPVTSVTCEMCSWCGSHSGLWIAVIPSTVVGINIAAFSSCSLSGVVIPTTVVYIGSYAFYGTTALKSVVIPTSVISIGQYSFRRSALESLILPFSISVLSFGAFQECKNLTTLEIQYNPINTYKLQVLSGAFLNDTALQCVFSNPSDFDKVAASCKGSCPLISSSCSRSPSLRPSTYYPNSSPTIIPTTTAAPSMRPSIYPTPYPITPYPSIVAPTPSTDFYYVICETCSLCGRQSGLWAAVIPSTVQYVQSFAFSSCGLSFVVIPTSVKYIGESAFANSSLRSVNIPRSVTAIGPSAFKLCSKLSSVSIPTSFKYISASAFANSSLGSVNIPASVTAIGPSAFEFCSELSSVSLPTSLNYIFSYAFQYTGALKSIFIPTSSFLEIKSYSFYRSALTTVGLPQSLTYFDTSAFEGCDLQCVYAEQELFTQVKDSCSSSCPLISRCSYPSWAPYSYPNPSPYSSSMSSPTGGLDFIAIFFIVFGVVAAVLVCIMVGYQFWFHSRRRSVGTMQSQPTVPYTMVVERAEGNGNQEQQQQYQQQQYQQQQYQQQQQECQLQPSAPTEPLTWTSSAPTAVNDVTNLIVEEPQHLLVQFGHTDPLPSTPTRTEEAPSVVMWPTSADMCRTEESHFIQLHSYAANNSNTGNTNGSTLVPTTTAHRVLTNCDFIIE